MNKKCSKCKQVKDFSCFHKDKYQSSGIMSSCKECYKVYIRSLDYSFRKSYRASVLRVKTKVAKYKNRIHSLTWAEWQLYKPQWTKLHKDWVQNEYRLSFRPTIDRIDNSKGYEAGNIQVITKSENSSKDIRGGNSIFTKLTEQQVREIRDKYIPRKYSLRKLAKEYGVSEPNIYMIIKYISWKHI